MRRNQREGERKGERYEKEREQREKEVVRRYLLTVMEMLCFLNVFVLRS